MIKFHMNNYALKSYGSKKHSKVQLMPFNINVHFNTFSFNYD